jgi:hypothetical protein
VFEGTPKEAAPRQGFFEPDAFERVGSALAADLQDVAWFAYLSG